MVGKKWLVQAYTVNLRCTEQNVCQLGIKYLSLSFFSLNDSFFEIMARQITNER